MQLVHVEYHRMQKTLPRDARKYHECSCIDLYGQPVKVCDELQYRTDVRVTHGAHIENL
jgi:hypothetical protein